MAKKAKQKSRNAVTSSAPKSYKIKLTAEVMIDNKVQPHTFKILCVDLPCTLADLAYECANACFSSVEELSFKAGIEFLPPKQL